MRYDNTVEPEAFVAQQRLFGIYPDFRLPLHLKVAVRDGIIRDLARDLFVLDGHFYDKCFGDDVRWAVCPQADARCKFQPHAITYILRVLGDPPNLPQCRKYMPATNEEILEIRKCNAARETDERIISRCLMESLGFTLSENRRVFMMDEIRIQFGKFIAPYVYYWGSDHFSSCSAWFPGCGGADVIMQKIPENILFNNGFCKLIAISTITEGKGSVGAEIQKRVDKSAHELSSGGFIRVERDPGDTLSSKQRMRMHRIQKIRESKNK